MAWVRCEDYGVSIVYGTCMNVFTQVPGVGRT